MTLDELKKDIKFWFHDAGRPGQLRREALALITRVEGVVEEMRRYQGVSGMDLAGEWADKLSGVTDETK